MSQLETQEKVRNDLVECFTMLDASFELPQKVQEYRPDYSGAWSIREHLEHVCLANHYLLLTITRGCGKARSRAAGGAVAEGESDLGALAPIAVPGCFDWQVPSHMIPTGRRNPAATRAELNNQRTRALQLLAAMADGAGRLCRIRMSVHSLGELDMYQWLYFMLQHARYHLALIKERAAAEEAGGGAGVQPR